MRSVDQTRNVVTLGDGSEIPYDHLVIATGATVAYFGIPGASQFAMPLYTLGDARRLRNRLLSVLEEAEVRSEGEHTQPSLTFVVVGGGPTGVETSGALSELISIAIRRDGLRLERDRIRVVLVDVAPRLLTAFVERAGVYAKKKLESSGIEVQFGRSVVAIDESSIHFDDGERLECAVVIWAAGVSAGDALPEHLSATSGPNGRVRVNPDLRLLDSDNVWAVGDAAAIALGATFCPQLAPVAIQSGHHCAEQILHVIDSRGDDTVPLSRQGHHGDHRSQRRGRRTAARRGREGPSRVARVARTAPVVPGWLPQPTSRVDQLDVALLRLALGAAPDRRRRRVGGLATYRSGSWKSRLGMSMPPSISKTLPVM